MKIDSPILLILSMSKHRQKVMETEPQTQDDRFTVKFDAEFRIPFKTKGSHKKRQKLIIALVADEGDQRRKLGQWELELSSLLNSEEECVTTTLIGSSKVFLFYRLVVKKRRQLSDIGRDFYFSKSPAEQTSTVKENVKTEPPKVDNTIPSHEVSETANPTPPTPDPDKEESEDLEMVNDSILSLLNSLNGSNRPDKLRVSVTDQNRINVRKAFLELLIDQAHDLSLIAFNQACIEMAKISYAFFHRELSDDISPAFIRILENFGVLKLPRLTEAQFTEFMKPFDTLLDGYFGKRLRIVELFPLLATVLNFGTAMAMNGLLYTIAHLSSMHRLEVCVDTLVFRIVHHLVAALSPSIETTSVDVEGKRSTDVLRDEVGLFMRLVRQYQIPGSLVEVLIFECCHTVDVLIFNSLVDAEDKITLSTTSKLMARVTQIQELFECTSIGLEVLFSNLVRFVSNASLFLGTFHMDKLGAPNPLTRAIADRCSPAPDVYPLSFDRLGPKVRDREQLKVPPHEMTFHFTYEWLFEHEHTPISCK